MSSKQQFDRTFLHPSLYLSLSYQKFLFIFELISLSALGYHVQWKWSWSPKAETDGNHLLIDFICNKGWWLNTANGTAEINDISPRKVGQALLIYQSTYHLSLRVFELLSSSFLLYPQRFGRYVLRPSSGVCRTREPSWNFELRPLLKARELPVLIALAITGYKC